MILKKEDYQQYLDIHLNLMHYVGIKMNCLEGSVSLADFLNLSSQDKYPSSKAIYDNIHLVDQYIQDKSDVLSNEEISILRAFKNFRRDKFLITKFTKDHALFMDDDFVFGVKALGDPFDSFWNKKELPVVVETALLPFKGQIIYDGILLPFRFSFGTSYLNSVKNESNRKIAQFGIILKLPIDAKIKNKEINHEELLIRMMKTKSSRDYNWDEIKDLLEHHPKLYPTFNKEWGRINSRLKKKELRALGIKNHHYAIYINTILTSGKTKSIVQKNITTLLKDEDKVKSVFYFKT